jgi:hypothetical protein
MGQCLFADFKVSSPTDLSLRNDLRTLPEGPQLVVAWIKLGWLCCSVGLKPSNLSRSWVKEADIGRLDSG